MMHMRRTIFASVLCLLLILVLCSCDMQGLVGELMDEQTEAQTIGLGGLGGIAGAMEIIGTDENGNYIAKGEDGTVILEGDIYNAFQGEINGSYSVIVGGNASNKVILTNPLAEIDAYEVSAFTPANYESDYVKITVRDYGEFVIRLRSKSAPETVGNFKTLVNRGFYNGLVFHRVIQNSLIMSGAYDEFGNEKQADLPQNGIEGFGISNDLEHVRGVISMTNANDGSASSIFFICDADHPDFDGRYTTFGYVVAGMEVVDKIAAVETDDSANPLSDVVIESIIFVDKIK